MRKPWNDALQHRNGLVKSVKMYRGPVDKQNETFLVGVPWKQPMRTWTLVYTSKSAVVVSDESLQKLASVSARNNAATGLTGLLLYGSGNFLQVLEGRKPLIEMLYKRIRVDPRHDHCEMIYQGEREGRLFPKWNMGALNLDGPDEQADDSELISTTLFKAVEMDWQEADPVLGWIRQFMSRNAGNSTGSSAA